MIWTLVVTLVIVQGGIPAKSATAVIPYSTEVECKKNLQEYADLTRGTMPKDISLHLACKRVTLPITS